MLVFLRTVPTEAELWRGEDGDGVPMFEPKVRPIFESLDKSIQKLRVIYKVHPEWFEVPKPKSIKDKNEIDYSV